MRTEEDEKLSEMLSERWYRLNESFVWTPESARKVIELNNGMLERYREAYNELVRVAAEYEERFRSGDMNYRDYTIDVDFWYDAPESQDKEENELWDNMRDTSIFWGPNLRARSEERGKGLGIEPFEEALHINDPDWDSRNEHPFNTKEFEGTYIYYFMHDIFTHNCTYTMQDAVKMKVEEFSWRLSICLEHWGKSRRQWEIMHAGRQF